jgi:hypothetical protein
MHAVIRSTFLAATCGLLLACGSKDATGPDGDLSGTIRFTYSGAGYNGTFNASGVWALSAVGKPKSNSMAAGLAETAGEHQIHTMIGLVVKGTKFDEFFANVSEQSTGTYTVGQNCSPVKGSVLCAFVEFGIDITDDDFEDESDPFFVLTSGEVIVTSVSEGRLKGTFSGTGKPSDGGTATISITNGTFDVPLRDPSAFAGMKSLVPAAVGF